MEWQVERSSASSRAALGPGVVSYLRRHAVPGAPLDTGAIVDTCQWLLDEIGPAADDRVLVRVDWSARLAVLVAEGTGPDRRRPSDGQPRATAGLGIARPDPGPFVLGPVHPWSPPAAAEVEADGTVRRSPFLKALLSQLALRVEARHGPATLDATLTQVGADVGNRIEDEHRRARNLVERLTPAQMGELFVELKRAIDGDFYVVEANDDQIVLGNRRCPFGDEAVKRTPSLCRVTSSVFGGIAARNAGRATVQLERRIAVGDPECRVVVSLRPGPDDGPDGDRYGVAADRDRPAPVEGPGPTPHDLVARLTDREREVLLLLAEGSSNQAIAQQLFISKSAVEKHLQKVFRKLRVGGEAGRDRRVEAALLYHRGARS